MSSPDYPELDYVCALDLETSGLDEQGDQILEVAALFGEVKGGVFKELMGAQIVLTLTSDPLAWHPKVLEMHTANGLLDESRASGLGVEKCDHMLAGMAIDLRYHGVVTGGVEQEIANAARWTLLGNSVHFDLRFVRRLFPRFAKQLSHRVIDVSAIRLFCESLGMPKAKSEPAHRAMADVLESLRLFTSYQQWIRTNGNEGQL